jgi:hypothetical protein
VKTTSVIGVLFLLAGGPSAQEVKIIKTCPVLTAAEAAEVLGKGTRFASGFEAPSSENVTLRCQFEEASRALTVQTVPTLGGKDAWEALRKIANGTLESGLGDYAYSTIHDGAPELWVVKGARTLELKVGKGGTAADVPKLREAAKKILPKI